MFSLAFIQKFNMVKFYLFYIFLLLIFYLFQSFPIWEIRWRHWIFLSWHYLMPTEILLRFVLNFNIHAIYYNSRKLYKKIIFDLKILQEKSVCGKWVQNGKRLTWQVWTLYSHVALCFFGKTRQYLYFSVNRPKEVEKGILGLSHNNLEIPNKHVNDLRKIIIYHISTHFFSYWKRSSP